MQEEKKVSTKQLVPTSILLLLVALVALAAVTYAWFTIADNTRVNLRMDITTGKFVRIEVQAHDSYEDYKPFLYFDEIRDYVIKHGGPDYNEIIMEPVTTTNGRTFTYEHGEPVTADDFVYVEYTLHFRSLDHVLLHLTTNNSKDKADGTRIDSMENPSVRRAMRISYTDPYGNTHIYNPRSNVNYTKFTQDTVVCELPADTDVPVVVRVWLEGNDPECTNALKGMDYIIQMRFEATDMNYQPLE